MPSLIQINSGINWGSTGRIAEQINMKAASQGWKVFFVYGQSKNPSRSVEIHIGNLISHAFALVEARLFDNVGLSNRLATKKLIRKIKKIGPDIIHLHNLHGYYINYRILFEFLNSTNIPVVWTLHDCWSFTGHCAHFVSAKCEKWRVECNDCPLRREYPSSLVFDRSNRNYTLKKQLFTQNRNLHIVAVSQWLADLCRESFLKDIDIRVIKNGVDLDLFNRKDVNTLIGGDNHKYRVLGVSSVWNAAKGIEDFIRLRKLLDSRQYEIILIGLTEQQIRKMPKGIVGISRTNSIKELVQYYSSANVFVNPTYCDTFPTTNIEALACGTPVVTYRTGGSPEAIDCETGFVVEQGDICGLSDCIIKICTSSREKYYDVCRKRAETYFNKDVRFSEYLKLYNDLLQKQ